MSCLKKYISSFQQQNNFKKEKQIPTNHTKLIFFSRQSFDINGEWAKPNYKTENHIHYKSEKDNKPTGQPKRVNGPATQHPHHETPDDFGRSTRRGDRIRGMIRTIGATRITSVSTQPSPLGNIAGAASPQNSLRRSS